MNDTFTHQDETEEQAFARIRDVRSRKALTGAPDLVEHLRSMVFPSDGRTERGVEHPVMSTPLISGIVDDADELYVLLLEWTATWSEILDRLPPTIFAVGWRNLQDAHRSTGYTDNVVVGFKAGATPSGARGLVQLLTTWLLLHADEINAADNSAQYQDEITTAIWSLQSKYPTRDRGRPTLRPVEHSHYARPCPVCGQEEVRGEWFSEPLEAAEARGENLLDGLEGITVRCAHCGWTEKPSAVRLARWLS